MQEGSAPIEARDGQTGGETVGVDLGDRFSQLCVIAADGEVIDEGRVRTSSAAFQLRFAALPPARVVLEACTHSPWVSRLLTQLGHEVIVANARRVRLIAQSDRKSDRTDAEQLARLGRLDPQLLSPIRHRGEETQHDLALVRSRDVLVRARTKLINHVRGSVKAVGASLPSCSAPAFHRKVSAHIPSALAPALHPLLEMIGELTVRITAAERHIERLCEVRYPETRLLRQVTGVGPITALTYVLTIEDPDRFDASRDVGPYLGLVPRRRDSGGRETQLRISKAGDTHLRRLLVGCAHHILGPFGADSDLRRWGERYASSGAKNARKRAVVAVARKLAVLLHALWVNGEIYEPLRHSEAAAASA